MSDLDILIEKCIQTALRLLESNPYHDEEGKFTSGEGVRPSIDRPGADWMLGGSGRISKRAEKAAKARMAKELFGPEGLKPPQQEQPGHEERLERDIKMFRDFVKRGFGVRKHEKEAQRLEKELDELRASKKG